MFDQALLVLTNTSGVARIESGYDFQAMALRPDQKDATQILFYDVDTHTIENVGLLNDAQPFIPTGKGTFIPNVAEIMPLMEPIECDAVVMNYAFTLGSIPELNIEAITVDPDELESDPNYIGSQIVDETILNRRCFTHEAAKRGLMSQAVSEIEAVRNQLTALLASD